MTPEVKLAPVWVDRKNDYRRHKEKQKIRRYSEEYGNGGFFCFCFNSKPLSIQYDKIFHLFAASRPLIQAKDENALIFSRKELCSK